MRKNFPVCIVILALSYSAASGAMRNLLDEFYNAIYAGNMNKVNSLIKEGLYVNDTIESIRIGLR